MTRETKVGIAMVLLLVGVFGFLVYKRFTRPIDAMAKSEQQAVEDDADAPEADRLQLSEDDDFPTAGSQSEPKILPVAGSTREIPQEEPGEVDDPFGGTATRTPAASTASTRPKLPTMIPDEESDSREDFAAVGDTDEAVVVTEEANSDGNDPFLESPGTVNSTAPKVVSSPPAMQFDAEETEAEESFAAEPVPVVRTPARAPSTGITPPAEFDEPETVSVQARAKLPEPSFDFGEDETEAEAPELVVEPKRPAAKSPVPQLMLDDSDEDRYGGYEPIELVDNQVAGEMLPAAGTSRAAPQTDFFSPETDARRSAVTIAGDSHIVQPGENFWSISQKKYGTGRYFQALAAYNQGKIPDATKMKSGVTIALPSEDELERRYPNLIPKGGPSEPAAADGLADQPGELLQGRDGRPLYRIGARDTLSGISQKYLGRSSRWMQIFEMNRDVLKDGNSLKVGAVLRLPTDAGELQLSNQPRAFR